MRWATVVLSIVALAAACSGPEPSRFGPTRVQTAEQQGAERPAPAEARPAEPAPRFGQTTDEASDEYLTRRIASELEREVREREQRQAEEERQRQQFEQEQQQQQQETVYGARGERPGYYFPWHTVLGGTIGGVIGHQSGHRDEGILIGASIGLLNDCLRWRW
jgi:hypothetical protein